MADKESASDNSTGENTSEDNRASENRSSEKDAIELLKQDHRKVENLFDKFDKADGGSERLEIARSIAKELAVHAAIEEQIFYPACRAALDDDHDIDEAQVEHDCAKILIAEIENYSSDRFFAAKVKVLSEQIKHHIREEEKNADSIFAKLKKTETDLKALGRKMAARKEELESRYERDQLEAAEPCALHISINQRKEYRMNRDRDWRNRPREDDGYRNFDEDGYGGRSAAQDGYQGRGEDGGAGYRRDQRGQHMDDRSDREPGGYGNRYMTRGGYRGGEPGYDRDEEFGRGRSRSGRYGGQQDGDYDRSQYGGAYAGQEARGYGQGGRDRDYYGREYGDRGGYENDRRRSHGNERHGRGQDYGGDRSYGGQGYGNEDHEQGGGRRGYESREREDDEEDFRSRRRRGSGYGRFENDDRNPRGYGRHYSDHWRD